MKNKQLIINADDYGWGKKLTDTIIECHLNGIVTSTTLMVNMPASEYAAKRALGFSLLSVGVHLNLTEGTPILPYREVPDLVNEQGVFPGNSTQSIRLWRYGKNIFNQVYRELSAQIEYCQFLGITPSHCDSHHGIHKLPVVRRAMVRAMLDNKIKRARTPLSYHRIRQDVKKSNSLIPWLHNNVKRAPAILMHILGHQMLRRDGIITPRWKASLGMGLPSGNSPKEQLLSCIAATPNGCSEILLHPGNHDKEDNPSDWQLNTWAKDTPICLDSEVSIFIKNSSIRLMSYNDLN
jgi:predicted glycoside hydrolase/deacetylase ChbG (UPF0249 family)